jgi:hypothetical protein
MKNRWYIQLKGDESDFNDIEWSLKNYLWSIFREDGLVFITNKDLNKVENVKEIRALGEEFIDILNGSLKCFYGNFNPVSVTTIFEFDPKTKIRKCYIGAVNLYERETLRANLTAQGEDKLTLTTIEKWLFIAQSDENVKTVLHFYNSPIW